MIRRALAAAALAVATPSLCAAQSVPGVRCGGTIVAQVNIQGQPVTIGGNVALYHKGSRYRLDLLSLGIPGAGGELGALATALIAPGGVSAVYDTATGTTAVSSPANHTYYLQTANRSGSRPPGAPGGAVADAGSAAAGAGDPLAALATVASVLRDVQTASIQLVGHTTVNGHPATNLDIQMRRQLPGRPLENYHAQLALADDLAGFPVQVVLQSTPATRSSIGGTVKLDLTNVVPDSPPDAAFEVPSSYRRVDSLGGVIGRSLP